MRSGPFFFIRYTQHSSERKFILQYDCVPSDLPNLNIEEKASPVNSYKTTVLTKNREQKL